MLGSENGERSIFPYSRECESGVRGPDRGICNALGVHAAGLIARRRETTGPVFYSLIDRKLGGLR